MLYCQQELTSLEEELVGMDKVDDDDSEECLRSVKADERRKLPLWRKQLLQQIKDKLFEYGTLSPLDGALCQRSPRSTCVSVTNLSGLFSTKGALTDQLGYTYTDQHTTQVE